MATLINVSSIMWARASLDVEVQATTGPKSVRPNASIFGLKSQEIKTANAKFASRADRENSETSFEKINIPFQYITAIPQWTKSANYNEENVIGRFEPLAIYANSSSQVLKCELIYHAESETNGPWSLEKIEEDYQPKIKSLVFPQYDGRFSPPTPMLLNIGAHFIDVPVVITNVSIDATGPFDFDGFKSHMRKISIDLRINYPLYQAISQRTIIAQQDNTIFAKKDFRAVT